MDCFSDFQKIFSSELVYESSSLGAGTSRAMRYSRRAKIVGLTEISRFIFFECRRQETRH